MSDCQVCDLLLLDFEEAHDHALKVQPLPPNASAADYQQFHEAKAREEAAKKALADHRAIHHKK